MSRLTRSASLTGYVDLARSLGLDPYRLARAVGLDRSCLFDPERKISTEKWFRLLEISASAARIEDFGLRLAEMRRLSDLGPIALAVRDATTLREVLETAIRYLPLHNEGVLLSLEEIGDIVIVKLELVTGRGATVRQATELTVGVTHRLLRQLFGVAWRSRPVWFSHSAPADTSSHLRVFGPWVEFGRDCNGILLEADDLDTPLPASDPAMAQHVKLYLEPMLAQVKVRASDQVRALVYDLLASGHASVEQVASRLGVSRKTLYRHLLEDGETFSSIVDAVRTDLAPRYVDDAGQSLTQVAELLGFSALSAFSRWFRAKFGCSPMSWRAAKGAGAAAASQRQFDRFLDDLERRYPRSRTARREGAAGAREYKRAATAR